MSLELNINLDFLQSLDPPSSFPPSEEELTMQIQNKFLAECQRFIINERILYKCSKSIENRLKSIVKNTQSIIQGLSSKQAKLAMISNQLAKYKQQDAVLRQRQKILNLLCQLIKMEELRKDLLIQDKAALGETQKHSLINEQEYLNKLEKLHNIIEQSGEFRELGNEFLVVREIVVELENIFQQAINLIVKKYMTPKMVELSLNKYNHIFFNKSKISQVFIQAIISNRLQSMKISLNPMINNLNYASNIPQLYESILTTWIRLIQQEKTLFSQSQQFQILRAVNRQLINQLIPKMERNIFRIKQLVAVVRIRKYFCDFWNQLKTLESGDEQQTQTTQTIILNVLMKCQAVIESQLNQQSSNLQSSKYNIYTLVSYIPIREHLQKIKICYQFSLENEQIDWQVGFYKLFASRDPKKHQNNKSLIIFNLNIWYLYLKIIIKGKYKQQGEQLMSWCEQSFTNINIQETNKKYYEAFEKLLEIGGNITAFKNTLYSELQLLGHQQLRVSIAQKIKQRYLSYYTTLLEKLQKKPMNNEQVKAYCTSKKINLNKFGKFSHSICIYSKEELQQILAYN